MIKTYTYKIKPNKSVQRKFEEQAGVCRYVYNLGREVREESFKKGVNINYFALSKQLTEAKKDFDWLKQVNSQTLQAVLERLELGYKKFFTDLKKGNKTSKPKWAKKELHLSMCGTSFENKVLIPSETAWTEKKNALNSLRRIPHWRKKGYEISDVTYLSFLAVVGKNSNYNS